VLIIGERPHDKARGEMFSRNVEEELNQTYLPLTGLHRADVRVESVCRCAEDGNKAPGEALVQSCSRHFLPRTLDRVKPGVLVLMGASACRILDKPLKLDTVHGIPQWASVLDEQWEGWVWPSYHPAERLGVWLTGDWAAPDVAKVKKDYRLVESARELREYLFDFPMQQLLAIDTESHGRDPWSVQISHTAHTGRLIRTTQQSAMQSLHEWMQYVKPMCVYHFAGHDQDELQQMGLPDSLPWRDTMQESFHQGDLPQGLKPLAYRLLGVTMRSWEDVVKPASMLALEEWLIAAHASACVNLTERRRKKTKSVRYEDQPSAVESICAHVLKHMTADPEYDPWEALDRFWQEGLRGKKPDDWQMDFLRQEIGPIPILGIGNCRLDAAVQYGCGDSDFTLQVADALAARRQDKRYEIFEGDRD
jgi:uracil-DNA glycosylase family 4